MENEDIKEQRILVQEYQWLLDSEVQCVLQDVHALLVEACRNFPLNTDHARVHGIIMPTGCNSNPFVDQERKVKPEKFLLSSSNNIQQVKCVLTLAGNLIYEADLALKLQKQQVVPHQTRIYSENPWRLQQIQDTGNHLLNALCIAAEHKDGKFFSRSGRKVISILDSIIDSIQLGRDCLTLPRKRTLEEIVRNPSLKLFKPALPNDAVVSFYIQAQKLMLAVYHLCTNPKNKIDIAARYQLECSVPWLNDSLLLFTLALHRLQSLKDKLTMLVQYEDELLRCVNDTDSRSHSKSPPESNSKKVLSDTDVDIHF